MLRRDTLGKNESLGLPLVACPNSRFARGRGVTSSPQHGGIRCRETAADAGFDAHMLTPVTEFAKAVEDVGQTFAEVDGGDYVPNEDRLQQADAVGPCVERFVVGELDASRELTPSRTGLPGSPPSLAEKLGRKFERASADTVAGLKDAVRKTLAVGYIFHGPIELDNNLSYRPARTAEDIWDFWAPSCRRHAGGHRHAERRGKCSAKRRSEPAHR